MATETVTIEKAYFEALLRRAQFHISGGDFTTSVTIPKEEHDSLLTTVRQYANLRRNLFQGGIAEETLTILIRDESAATENGTSTTYSTIEGTNKNSTAFLTQQPSAQAIVGQDYTYGRNANYTPRNGELRPRDTNTFQPQSPINDDYAFVPDGPADGFYDGGSGNNDSQTKLNRQQYDKFAKRTVLLANLPDGTSHIDVVNAVRGGMLLDIYLRSHDRTASISFLEEAHAQEFFRHVRRHDLYIRGKRVGINWNNRQFILQGHVANKIALGATRNLVIRNRSPRHTEETIRDDLEHIHNLVVIKVDLKGRDAYISTNSVHNAMFARTCMMSRSTYKGLKIDWDDDECAAPLVKPQQYRKEDGPKKKDDSPLMNRFHLLNMDESEEEDHDTSGITFPSTAFPSTIGLVA